MSNCYYFGLPLYQTDYDLAAALLHNEEEDLIEQVEKVLLELAGENDGASWHWIVKFKSDPKFGYISGGCDYTGWD